ncbi:MAG: AGE family epimerase/isomerase [Candidatus Sumerlaeia bacterium]|nr:AGE family epimerase/isomerase [Candidatus Sumerlaeia bacterium]
MPHSLLRRLEQLRDRYHTELHEHVIPFWMKNSLDTVNGGYFNCLDRDGKVYDTTKHLWLQGRQVWMLSKLYNTYGDEKYLRAATLGANFLQKFGKTTGQRVYFSLTKEGKPVFMQRKMFSECFYAMAMAEYARAARSEAHKQEARAMLQAIFRYAEDITLVGRPVFEGAPATSSLAVPMILLNLIAEIADPGETTYAEREEWCVRQLDKHIRPELERVMETVNADGTLLNSPEGRLLNPGHAIEAGWFLLDYAQKKENAALKAKAFNMINWSMAHGWDSTHGGLFYFQDLEGYSPVQLEWSMKLWWPHCEALVALIKCYADTKDERYLTKFEEYTDYSFLHFSDPEFGEWYGYLDRNNRVTHRFKGGPYKGFFHVPRALFLCLRQLDGLLQTTVAE